MARARKGFGHVESAWPSWASERASEAGDPGGCSGSVAKAQSLKALLLRLTCLDFSSPLGRMIIRPKMVEKTQLRVR